MSYDIAAKVLIEKCRGEILRRFLGIQVTESTILEDVPQETTSVRRSDFPVLVTEANGRRRLALIEVQSHWESGFPLRLLEYRCRHQLRHDVEVVSCVLLLQPSASATDRYEDAEVSFRYRLVRVYELDADEVIGQGALCLLPLVPLMRHGAELTEIADQMIYESSLPQGDKADMLTTMALLAGLTSKTLAELLFSKRRDMMIESKAYELLGEMWMTAGLEKGRQEGIHLGLLNAIAFGLDVRFGPTGLRLLPEIERIQDVSLLRAVQEHLKLAKSPDELRTIYQPA